jgi:hypothetical protein
MTFEQEMKKFWASFPKSKLRPVIEGYLTYQEAIQAEDAEAAQRIACLFLDNKPNTKDSKSERRRKKERTDLIFDYKLEQYFRVSPSK